ncbi:hypothetical protein KCTC52924_01453 [Arenibacter antarcticus]|uniref:Uncharacterized protein n=1 Tax=Arenibacter antarcticus TaxID=2040469 RepID=A0ABW5VDZ7_9FLAO|nr:hypothetical protein [Arenibacter sp. H213]MCM4167744.1 hypothetical protein [Arenibacter sp. H213]
MKKRLKEELRKLSTEIITSRNMGDINYLYESAKELYEKLTVLKYIEEKLNEVEIDVSKSSIGSKFETMANSVLNANSSVPENNPHEEDIIIPGIDTIKDMVSEMPSGATIDEVLSQFTSKPELFKNDKDLFMPKEATISKPVIKQAANHAHRDIKVDLNDKLAFVKHLFNNSMEDYSRVLSQLSTIDSAERSVSFIVNMVKPDYDNWVGKEEYEARFMTLILRKFV